jgi:hypothetical protein
MTKLTRALTAGYAGAYIAAAGACLLFCLAAALIHADQTDRSSRLVGSVRSAIVLTVDRPGVSGGSGLTGAIQLRSRADRGVL